MLNATTRLAVSIRYLPDWEIDWEDCKPQKSRKELRIEDVLPSEADGLVLRQRAVQFIMRLMVTEFKSLANLSQYVPQEQPLYPVMKTQVAPMKLLFRDEKYTAGR